MSVDTADAFAPTIDTLTLALDGYDAGLCIVKVKTNGDKRPEAIPGWGRPNPATGKFSAGWKRMQIERPPRPLVADWFVDNHPGIGVICGTVSGYLELLEFEGRALNEGVLDRFITAVQEAGLGELVGRIRLGYSERTPSDGLHLLYRIAGNEPMSGNTKLASRLATAEELAANPKDTEKVYIETRGEGGFAVLAPSHGPVHKSGKPYELLSGSFATIATITSAERDALIEVCKSLNELPEQTKQTPPPPSKASTFRAFNGGVDGNSWMDAVTEHLAASSTMLALLERHGWQHHSDVGEYTYVTRPGKDDGVSGFINTSDRLGVHSSSTPFPSNTGTTKCPTFDRLDVIAMYEYSGDRQAAARHIAEQTGIMAAWQAKQDAWLKRTAEPPPNVDTETGEIIVDGKTGPGWTNLPLEFWNARTVLARIRQAAHSRSIAADSVLGCVLARVATLAPPSLQLPPIVASNATLDLIIANVAESGGGKSASQQVGAEYLPIHDDDVVLDFPVGSGEGVVDAYLGQVEDVDLNGKKVKVRRQVKRAVLAVIDEGQVLAEFASRKGSTLMPTLRAAWTGSVLGQGNASVETNRRLSARSYRFAAIISVQPAHAAAILADAPGGTPQRILWFSAEDPSIPDIPPTWPGQVSFTPPQSYILTTTFTVADDIADEVRTRKLARSRGTSTGLDPLDSHADLLRLKVAALLAVLDERLDVNDEDWRLAGMVMRASHAVRTLVGEHARQVERHREEAATGRAVRREVAVVDGQVSRTVDRCAKIITRKVREHGEMTRGEAWRSLASRDRQQVTIDEVVERAISLRWLTTDGDLLRPGEAGPT